MSQSFLEDSNCPRENKRRGVNAQNMLKKVRKLISPLAATAAAMTQPIAALAQGESGDIVPPVLKENAQIIPIIQAVIRFILVVAFVLAFIFLLIGGIRWIIAGGDEKAVAGARNTITAALIGLVIVLVAFALIRLVEIFFGVSIISAGVTIPTVRESTP